MVKNLNEIKINTLYNNKYDRQTLKENIYAVKLIDILKTQELDITFIVRYILSDLYQFNEEDKKMFYAKIKNAKRKNVISLIDNLGWDDLARIETSFHKLPGVSIESGIIRKYPYPFETAHFLGYVSLPAEKEIEENEQNLFMHPDFRIGKSGIEKTFDAALRGKYGVKYVEVNVHEVPLRTLSVKQPTDGSRIKNKYEDKRRSNNKRKICILYSVMGRPKTCSIGLRLDISPTWQYGKRYGYCSNSLGRRCKAS